MKKFNLFISRIAQRQLYEMDKNIPENIKSHIKELRNSPFISRSGADIKKLKGSKRPAFYRLRVGNVRVIYTVIKNDVKITEIIKRGRGYEWLD